MSSPAQLDLGECCKTSTNVHLNSSQLWGIQPHSWVLFAFLGISMKMGVCLHKYLRNERKNPKGIHQIAWKRWGFLDGKGIFWLFSGWVKTSHVRDRHQSRLARTRFLYW